MNETILQSHLSGVARPGRSRLIPTSERVFAALAVALPVLAASGHAMADDGTGCSATNGQNCVINSTGGTGGQNSNGSGQGGGNPSPASIDRTFTDTTTYIASDGSYGAIDFRLIGGNGGDVNSGVAGHGKDGGGGAAGGAITVNVGGNVTTQGSYDGGVQRYMSQGGTGGQGGGHDTLTGQSGTAGTGGAGAMVQVSTSATVSSTDAATSGIVALSLGGTGGAGQDGGTDFFAPYAGGGGSGGSVTLDVGGTVNTSATGVYVRSQGGQGGQGPNDNAGSQQADGRNGGQGGGASTVNVTIAAQVSATGAGQNGIDAGSNGGIGGAGGHAQEAPQAIGGNGGNGGNGGTLNVVLNGGAQVNGAAVGVQATSNGGDAGSGGYGNGSGLSSGGNGGSGGIGGHAGTATATIEGNARVTAGLQGAAVYANGGQGGAGGASQAAGTSGGSGGAGGDGGAANVNLGPASVMGALNSAVTPVSAIAAGGNGGAGAAAYGTSGAQAGSGGNGGSGGIANAHVISGGTAASFGIDNPAQTANAIPGVLVRSNGGAGGAGGDASAPLGAQGGGAGFGGAGGSATALIDGTVSTTGTAAHGVLVQSVGGAGGGGGEAASLFFSQGGAAHNGGAGGTVTVGGNEGTVQTIGSGSAGVLAQSIGGGGGSGGNALSVGVGVAVAVGGNGGGGGDGQAVRVGQVVGDASTAAMSDTVITRGAQAAGIVAQSVGGAGGHGGNAVSIGTELVHLVIGGDGKGGGAGGQVSVNNAGLVTTFGTRSGGILAQSIGGGGGIGGSTFAVGADVLNAGVAVGGQGGGGGSGANVNLNNAAQVTTYGNDAFGLSAQSISGGGGHGGATTDVAVSLGVGSNLPSVAIDVAVGGAGGAGGNQSQSVVALNNSGFISTAGEGALGLVAQNIAGGGGTGGDSSALSYAYGNGATVSVAVGAGGNGGASGTGGAVNVNNSGLVLTMGGSSHALVAQSIGGGGGVGGAGDSSALASGTDSRGVSIGLSVGGQGGSGSIGGTVTVVNNAGLGTSGDGARAILAQSIGGGGGASGGGTAVANGQDLSLAVTVGGNAGSGGNGGSATVTSSGPLVTNGADADGILVQSIGGGGGLAGKGSSSAGTAATPGATATALLGSITNGLGIGQNGATQVADKVFKVLDSALNDINNVKQLQKALGVGGGNDPTDSLAVADNGGGDDDSNGIATGLQLSLTVGGKGGAGGNGGAASGTNSGNVLTAGARADGLMVQSIGGGGGVGGASTFSGTIGQNSTANNSLTLGANGAAAGAGGSVSATNTSGASITTSGVLANGMVGQSIGGGGGDAGVQGNTGGALINMSVVVGGKGGAGGNGGAVAMDNEGTITTQGAYASGIVAQSIGGGGGTASVLTSNAATSGLNPMQLSLGGRGGAGGDGGAVTISSSLSSSASTQIKTQGQGSIGVLAQSIGGGGGSLVTTDGTSGKLSATVTLPLVLGGSGGASGNGGAVTMNLGRPGITAGISTNGQDAHAVLAQSIGGGGGFSAGTSNVPTALSTLFGSGTHEGSGGSVAINATAARIFTNGDGAAGVLVQSIGGGGGLFGAVSQFKPGSAIQATPVSTGGQGGNVTVNLTGSIISTEGTRAHGVFAQSFGGGGGLLGTSDGNGVAFAGASPYAGCTGSACTGAINVSLANTTLMVGGPESYGIYVQSRGNGVNDTTISLDSNSLVSTEDPAGIGIFVDGAGTNQINNSGLISAMNGAGVAIAGNQPATINITGGNISGSIHLPKGSSTLTNEAGGTLNAGSVIELGNGGLLSNAGTLEVGGGAFGQTRVHARLEQSASGRTVIDVDTIGRRNDAIAVDGSASLAGTVKLRPTTLSPSTFTVLSATQGLTVDPALKVLDGGGNLLFGYRTTLGGAAAPGAATGALAKADDGATLSVTPFSKLGTAAVLGGLGANRNALALHLDSGFGAGVTPAQGAVYAQLSTLTSLPAYARALDNLSGELLQSASLTRMAGSISLTERMNTARCAGPETMGELAPEADCNWARVVDSRTTRNATSDELGFRLSDTGLQAGLQRRIGGNWFAGGAIAYVSEQLQANGVDHRIDGNNLSVAGALKYASGPWTIAGSADLGYGRYDDARQIAFAQIHAQARGEFDMWHAGLHARIAYSVPTDGFYLRPYLDLHAVRVRTGNYAESGAGALNLQMDSNAQNFFAASPMLELGSHQVTIGGADLRGFAAVGAIVASDGRATGQAHLQGWAGSFGVPPFEAASSVPSRRAKVQLGATLALGGGKELTFAYDGEYASGYRSNAGILQFRYLF
ncbi:autotransporter outer membrane beta-barrel domain-containing protein [Variovorax sp. Sphag1AA]|uniref:autotransporter outer membrane beta-barrel domain-containing protein n=1 Tax=Variovorax sp. Sphag1AA TaxID=2587027 RepID=UPI001617C6E5|nr:autotransporter outer membrane beta-barrel domain-containing protein [Variovorax sp. Sphag1AA]MBB3181637.1 hypothetical protein [Variovorax sp. Sphag1AA]